MTGYVQEQCTSRKAFENETAILPTEEKGIFRNIISLLLSEQ